MANLTRRGFLQLVTLGTATGAVLSACKGGDSGGGSAAGGGPSCNDTTGLTDADKQLRNTLGYVDRSTQKGKECANCNFFQPKGENVCGGCQIMKGPVAPQGYCNSWVQKPGAPTPG